jgi:hypothetical protein
MTAPAPAPVAQAHYGLAAAVAARQVQLAIRARLMQDVARLWRLLDPQRLAETFPGWVAAMTALIRDYHAQSAQGAAVFYRSARAAAVQSPTPVALIRLAEAPSAEWLRRALGFAGPGMLSRDTARPGTALSTTLGTAARIALDGGRSTIVGTVHADPVAVGFFRVTDGQPCAFCAMLAGRGVVYKSAETVDFKAHNDCGCFGAPAFSKGQPLPEISDRAAQVYRERGPGDSLKAFRKAWADHTGRAAVTSSPQVGGRSQSVPGGHA